RDPQVDENRARGREHDVVGFDVAVRDAVSVRVLERAQHFHGDPPDVRDTEPGLPAQRLTQIVAGHVRHHVPEEIVRLSAVDQAGDVRVVELRGVADSTQEAAGGDRNDEL